VEAAIFDVIASAPFAFMQEDNIAVYPNPVSGNLTIEVFTQENFKEVSIFNITGEKIFHSDPIQIHDAGNSRMVLDFRPFPAGSYWIELRTDKMIFRKSVVKNNSRD
jgi:hypothetical protein